MTALFRHPLGIPIPPSYPGGRTPLPLGSSSTIQENQEIFRQQLRRESPWWVPEPIDEVVHRGATGHRVRLASVGGFDVDPEEFMEVFGSQDGVKATWRDLSLARVVSNGFPTDVLRQGATGRIIARGYTKAEDMESAIAAST